MPIPVRPGRHHDDAVDLHLARALARQMALGGSVCSALSGEQIVAHLEAANDVDPEVTVIQAVKTRSWPKHPDAPLLKTMPLSLALELEHGTDALLLQYRALRPQAQRLGKEALLALGTVHMVVLPLDVDCPAELKADGLAPNAWLALEREKVARLIERHPGGIYYPTRGGYRVLYRLPRVELTSDEEWTATFRAHLAYVERDFEIRADPAMSSWVQPCKLPRVPSTAVRGGVVEGDIYNVGAWVYAPSAAEVDAHRDPKRAPHRTAKTVTTSLLEKLASGRGSGEDPWLARGRAGGVIGVEIRDGQFAAECPRYAQHTTDTGPSSTVYFRGSGFKCLHGHCGDLSRADFYRFIESKEAKRAELGEVEQLVRLAYADSLSAPVAGILPTGTGKSFQIRRLVSVGAKVAIGVPTHALAREQDSLLRSEYGVNYAHHAAVTKETNERAACVREVEARETEALGLSVRGIMCPTCEHVKTCDARKPPSGVVPIAPFQRMKKFADDGRSLIFDEQFPITESFVVTARELAIADKALRGVAGKEFSALVTPWVRHLMGYTSPTEDALRYANEIYRKPKTAGRFSTASAGWVPRPVRRVDPSLPFVELARACADVAQWSPDRAKTSTIRSKKDANDLVLLAAAAKVRRAAQKGAKIERIDGELHVRVLSSAAMSFRDAGGLVLSATPKVLALKALRPDVRVRSLSIPDAAHRTLIEVGDMNTTALKANVDRLRHYFELVVAKARAAGCARVLVVVAKTVEQSVKAMSDGVTGLVVAVEHYGPGIIGRDEWKDFDGFATIGENWYSLPEVEEEAAFLGIADANEYARQIVEADLCQAHGRARDPRRETPAHHWHVGRIRPAGWTAENTVVEAAPCHRTARAETMTPEALRALVERVGPQREVAKKLGIPRTTLAHYVQGGRVAPAAVVEALAKLAG